MKFFRLSLFLLFVPSLLFALHRDECREYRTQALSEWNQANAYIDQLNQLQPEQRQEFIRILSAAAACCQRAIDRCNTILHDIERQSKEQRKKEWRVEMKNQCEQYRSQFAAQMTSLQNELNIAVSFEKAETLYREGAKKAELAKGKELEWPKHRRDDAVLVAVLGEISRLYAEAASAADEASALISFSLDADTQAVSKYLVANYREAAGKYKKAAVEWPMAVAAQKAILKERLETLRQESRLLEEQGLKRSSYETQKQMALILEQMAEGIPESEMPMYREDLARINDTIARFEEEADAQRLTRSAPRLSQEEFTAEQEERRALFFKSDMLLSPNVFLQTVLHNRPRPVAIPLDGQRAKDEKTFALYSEQFYRFLVQSDTAVSQLFIRGYFRGQLIHAETIDLPQKNSPEWEEHLRTDGLLFIPTTELQEIFGLELRLSFVHDPRCEFSLVVAHKSEYSDYQFTVSLDDHEILYACDLLEPPPWQLDMLRKPVLPSISCSPGKPHFYETPPTVKEDKQKYANEFSSFPILDRFVEELKGDPLSLAQYVHNEIALADPFLCQDNGVFQAPGIQRNACMTFLEKEGSPWEQCQLLVYLLRKAGYSAAYVMGSLYSVPKAFAERLLFTKLPEEEKTALLQYPAVLFFNGKQWISLFPWMKEIEIHEGYDLYNCMSDEYATADRWILRYLQRDEKIVKYIGPDGDDTAGVLFVRFVEEELRKQGLALDDVGVRRTQRKKQFASWGEFPRPSLISRDIQILDSLEKEPGLFAAAEIKISSSEDPQKQVSRILPLSALTCTAIPIRFSPREDGCHDLHIGMEEKALLELDPADETIDVALTYHVPVGSTSFHAYRVLKMAKGTAAALCFHFGGASSQATAQFYEQFSSQTDESLRPQALLAVVGAAYFEKCSRAAHRLAGLHKVSPTAAFAFGLAMLAPDHSLPSEEAELKLPQVDMFWFHSQPPDNLSPAIWHQEIYTARRQFQALVMVDSSSNEHQILREFFKDPYAVSTVKLLQLAHLQHQKQQLEGEGFLALTPLAAAIAATDPQAVQDVYFPHLQGLDLQNARAASPAEWEFIDLYLDPASDLSSWTYALATPGMVLSQDGTYKEMGALILHPYVQFALISHNNLLLHGGLGSPIPSIYTAPFTVPYWNVAPNANSYTFEPFPKYEAPMAPELPKLTSDVRPEHKSVFNSVADPVDVVTGAFYLDEADLVLPGPLPLEIRRNYNSQNPLPGDFGCGWKSSLNPYLVEQDGKLYAAEPDGTVIAYRFNESASRWEIFPEDNPALGNFNQRGIGSIANPFHAYIENDILYGTDGSRRFFEGGLLKKWVDLKGNTLTFTYNDRRLVQIESSNGDFCGFHYNYEGKISEIYAKDGRRISYTYDSRGDLAAVTLPNTAVISYEYDRLHRIIRETKPHGQVLENVYDAQGRVKEQRAPMGPAQEIITNATFVYNEGETIVTDAGGGCTIYQIFQDQIYKITDPLGYTTLQSWFIDEKTWFDAETKNTAPWDLPGGYPKSLKTSIDKRGLATHYLYDSLGNAQEIRTEGADLTGGGIRSLAKKFTYNERNLCTQEEALDRKTLTTYDDVFPYLPKKIEKISAGALVSSTSFEYNALGQTVKKDSSGSITLWKYDSRGLPKQRTQVSGTDDPNVVTAYSYNNQGQCTQMMTPDAIWENKYDIMGNRFRSEEYSHTGTLLSIVSAGYNLNNQLIWQQTANPQNTLYLDYNAFGALKASRQTLSPSNRIAYTLYAYDSRGNLIQEVDPCGYCTDRTYDPLCRLRSETKAGLSTLFTYEAGGLLATIASPSGAATSRIYTSSGLLKEEIHPDGTKSSAIYDLFGRPIRQTVDGITWEITYDDPGRRVIRTHAENTEIHEFDARGNFIRFTDAAGYTTEKTYDSLNRLKTETSPTGQKTVWNYQKGRVTCILPNGETTISHYAGRLLLESETLDAQGSRIAHALFDYDPETDTQIILRGDETTIIQKNVLGKPVTVQKGDTLVFYKYDACGNCTVSTDGEGNATIQTFDPLGRLASKELPDGSLIKYGYDPDSNLTSCRLPNGVSWTASYDSMGRKRCEELQTDDSSSQRWEYTYQDSRLAEVKDPLQRIRTYQYDTQGRVIQEDVDGWRRIYTYDGRGLLRSAQQTRPSQSWLAGWLYSPENAYVERSYDADGRLVQESIFLNSQILQQTSQEWSPSSRTLRIGDHERTFSYHHGRLTHISTPAMQLAYAYHLNGALKSKASPLHTLTLQINDSGLPASIGTSLPDNTLQETLSWNAAGQLSSYASPDLQKQFHYTPNGHLRSAEEETYDYDFGSTGTGVRTSAPHRQTQTLDPFGRVFEETSIDTLLQTIYNPMGEVSSCGQTTYEWDPWGRLIKITDPSFTWEASYDAFGRRLQTHHTPRWRSTLTTTSFYDPEQEFREIGVQHNGKTFWKLYGPDACDAVVDDSGASAILIHNALGQLSEIISTNETLSIQQPFSAYGPLTAPPFLQPDLISFARSLSWRSVAQDPTGLIWMGARYYDPQAGRFLSPDPVGHPICLDLYAYANGDPINYFDPDGRFWSPVYKPIVNAFSNPYVQGGLRTAGGLIETSLAAPACLIPGAGPPLAAFLLVHGADQVASGLSTLVRGAPQETFTSRSLQQTGMSRETAELWDGGASMAATIGAGTLINIGKAAAFPVFRLPTSSGINSINQELALSRGAANINASAALRSKLSGLQKAQGCAVQIRNLPDGRIRYYSLEVPASKLGLTKGASYVTEWNPSTGQVRSWMENYDYVGQVIRVHPKMINGQTVDSIHYPLIGSELGVK